MHPIENFDIAIYGGTSSAIIAAVQAKIQQKTVVIISPDRHLGGLSSGGLGYSDTGEKHVIGGLSREFYHRIWQHYQSDDAWTWERKEDYGNVGQCIPAIDSEMKTMWIFEPHVAERVFEDFIAEYGIPVYREEFLDRQSGVTKENNRIVSITTLSGKTIAAKMFIDATYEGDLMASAGVSYAIGRESCATYGEEWNGIQTGVLHHNHHFGVIDQGVSPYRTPGDPESGLLPYISPEPPGAFGDADHRVQAYCYRMCFSKHPDNRVPFPKPPNYNPDDYALLTRIFESGWRSVFNKFDPIPNLKTDTNNHGPMSSDFIGGNYGYPDGSYTQREEIIEAHKHYQQGLLYFLSNAPQTPAEIRGEMQCYGLAADEFTDNDHWPHQLYIREARRMVGEYVLTENELLKRRPTPNSVGMGSYPLDSHNTQRYIAPEGYVQNEGDIGVKMNGPYAIPYGSLTPRKEQCENLIVPVCVSSSHIAFGSIRMEPVFMILGQSAATAAALAIEQQCALQDLPYERLEQRLITDGQVLHYASEDAKEPARVL
ncbi:FAD-dependent oxidoreductase [Cerasicoccus frondis]|uniref:FAD-dependent oxidoreductase n=1 Tax=Cerasicoccus frondis TaxID=490090 RepID=UPI002852948C|nr:FAD-dependent oxidoreductase [Cerasicoccus frondis]